MASSLDDEMLSDADLYTLHDIFRIIGDQLTQEDIEVLKSVYDPVLGEELVRRVNNGREFFLTLEKQGRVDDANLREVRQALKTTTRLDLIHLVSLTRRRCVTADPVNEYLENSARHNTIIPFKRKQNSAAASDSTPTTSSFSSWSSASYSRERLTPTPTLHNTNSVSQSRDNCSPPSAKRSRRIRDKSRRANSGRGNRESKSETPEESEKSEIKRKVTCDIRLRVRAEFCQHENALEGNVNSNKPELVERQFEKFLQANTILKSRDLGSIICDIKFSELTYLDAFWRDYINGALLEALKGVFITESLKQAVGHEAIKLMVNVDEDDYEAGRLKLLANLVD